MFSEDLERLLFERFLTTIDDSSIPDIIKCLLEDRKAKEEDLTNIEFDSRVLLFHKRINDSEIGFEKEIMAKQYNSGWCIT